MAFPSTFLDIQTKVISRATLDATDDLADVKDWINKAYFKVCVAAEAIPGTSTMTLTAGSASYTLPAGVARIKQMVLRPAGSTQFNPPLILTTLDEILARRQAGGDTQTSGSTSTLYTLVGINDLELWPTPAAADVISVYYFAYPTALSSDGDVPALEEPYATDLLMYGALVEAGDFKGDPATPMWAAKFEQLLGEYVAHLREKRGDQPGQFYQWGDGWSWEQGAINLGGYGGW